MRSACGLARDRGPQFVLSSDGYRVPDRGWIVEAVGKMFATVSAEAVRPIHYADAVRRATSARGVCLDADQLRCAAEDLRQACEAGHDQFCYVSRRIAGVRPEVGLLFLRAWLPWQRQRALPFDDGIAPVVELDQPIIFKAGDEARARQPFMVNWAGLSETAHFGKIYRGLAAEAQVREYFRAGWPAAFLPPTNAGDVRRPAADDFRLVVNGQVKTVDVARANASGRYGGLPRKPSADIHILIECIQDRFVGFVGWCGPHAFRASLSVGQAHLMRELFFVLNCNARGLDMSVLRAAAGLGGSR